MSNFYKVAEIERIVRHCIDNNITPEDAIKSICRLLDIEYDENIDPQKD